MPLLHLYCTLRRCTVKHWSCLICKHPPGTIVKLYITTSCLIKICKHFSIRLDNISDQLFIRIIIFICMFSVEWHGKLCQKLCRRRHCLLCHSIFILQCLHETKMFYKRMLSRYPYFSIQICVIHHGSFSMKWQPGLGWCMSYAIERPHKIKMPCSSAELSVCNDMIAQLLCFLNQLCDCLILYLL